jgi:transposase InsO family protein
VLVNISRSSVRYEVHGRDDEGLAGRLRAFAEENKRYGYRQAWAQFRGEGMRVNHKRVYRIWRKEGLALPRRRKRPRPKTSNSVPVRAEYPNHVWTYDFMQDATEEGRKLRLLTLIDEFTRENLAIELDRRMPAKAVLAVLDRVMAERGTPKFLRSDNGPEFIAKAVKSWLKSREVQPYYIEPGCPWQNAFGESFNARFRDECLNMEVFCSVAEARVIVRRWRRHYNQERRHSSLGYLTPVEFRLHWEQEHGNGSASLPSPMSLSHFGLPVGQDLELHKANGQSQKPCPTVQSPASALESHSCVALSSARAENSLPLEVGTANEVLNRITKKEES